MNFILLTFIEAMKPIGDAIAYFAGDLLSPISDKCQKKGIWQTLYATHYIHPSINVRKIKFI